MIKISDASGNNATHSERGFDDDPGTSLERSGHEDNPVEKAPMPKQTRIRKPRKVIKKEQVELMKFNTSVRGSSSSQDIILRLVDAAPIASLSPMRGGKVNLTSGR